MWPSSSWARVDPSSTTRSPRHSLCEQLRRLVINMIRGSSYGTAWYSNVSVTVRRFLFSRIQGDHNVEHHWSKWVCLKIGYIPNYSHLIGIMIINHWVLGVHYFQTHPYWTSLKQMRLCLATIPDGEQWTPVDRIPLDSHRSDLQRGPGGWGGRKASTLPAEVWTGCSQKRVSKTVTERQFQMFQYVPVHYSERLQVW